MWSQWFISTVLYLVLTFSSVSAQNCLTAQNQNGYCTRASLCTQIGDHFVQYNSQSSNRVTYSNFISNSLCGYDGYDFLVCCATVTNAFNSPTNNYASSPAQAGFQFGSLGIGQPVPTIPGNVPGTYPIYPTNYYPSYPTMYPNDPFSNPFVNPFGGSYGQYTLPRDNICGLSTTSQNKVVGGTEAQRGAYPWLAALGYGNQYGGIPRFLCGGSLITQRHVATSAHCVTNDLYMVRLGAHDLNVNQGGGAVDVAIERKILHPSFDSRTISNDLALLKLSQDVPITNTVRPICLPISEPMRSQDFTGYNPFIAGWGAVTFQGPASNVLRNAQVPVVNLRTCEASYRARFANVALGNDIICAGDGSRDACQGDSGGPLMLPELSSDRTRYNFYLIGVVSYGYECARPGFPGVYTRVASFIPWIESQLNI